MENGPTKLEVESADKHHQNTEGDTKHNGDYDEEFNNQRVERVRARTCLSKSDESKVQGTRSRSGDDTYSVVNTAVSIGICLQRISGFLDLDGREDEECGVKYEHAKELNNVP
jgi:hypothetical protein